MKQQSQNVSVTEVEMRELESSMESARSARLAAMSICNMSDEQTKSSIKDDPLYASESLENIRGGLDAHLQVVKIMQAAMHKLEVSQLSAR